jgi:Mor family transcriptional regulator
MNDKNEVFDELTQLLGSEQAGKVAAHFAGSSVYIPKSLVVAEKHRRIAEEYRGGATYRELSLKYGYTERYVRIITLRKRRGK